MTSGKGSARTSAGTDACPLITVAMSVRNCEQTVARAVASILTQTEPRFDLLITDDGSTDRTREVVGRFADARIRLMGDASTRGLPVRLNEMIGVARGDFIARMDGDDFSYPDRFARQMAFLEANPAVDLVGSSAVAFRANGEPIGAFRIETAHDTICKAPHAAIAIPHPTWMGRTAWFRRHPYPETARRAQDQALLITALADSTFANLAEPLLGYAQDIPSLESVVGGRWNHAKAIAGVARQTGDWRLLAKGVGHHALRAALTALPLIAGQGEALLSRRFRPLSDRERERFLAVRARLVGVP